MKKNKLINTLKSELNSIAIPNVLEKAKQTPIVPSNKQTLTKNSFKTRLLAGSLVSMLIIFALFSAFYPFYASNSTTTLTIDINPSITLTLDSNDNIIKAQAINSDAENLLSQLNLLNKSFDNAFNLLLEKAAELGYLTYENENAILVSITNNRENIKTRVEQNIKSQINTFFAKNNMQGSILIEEYKKELEEKRKALQTTFEEQIQISNAKYQLITKITEKYPNLKNHEEQLAKINIASLKILLNGNKQSFVVLQIINQILQNSNN